MSKADEYWNTNYDTWIKGLCDKAITPLKAIRYKCMDCSCASRKEIRNCQLKDSCTLWPYRLGKNPYYKKRKLSDKQLDALRANQFKKTSDNNGENEFKKIA